MLFSFRVDPNSALDLINQELKIVDLFKTILLLINPILKDYDYDISFDNHQMKLLFGYQSIAISIGGDYQIYINYFIDGTLRSKAVKLHNCSDELLKIVRVNNFLTKNEQMIKDIIL